MTKGSAECFLAIDNMMILAHFMRHRHIELPLWMHSLKFYVRQKATSETTTFASTI